MRLPILAAVAAALLLVSPAAAQSDYAAREVRARALFGAMIVQLGEEQMREARGVFRDNDFSAAEREALEQAFDAEAPLFVQFMEEKMIAAAARHVPLDQMREDANFGSPEWTAAGEEMTMWGRRGALDLVARVASQGCTVQASPSAKCVAVLQRTRNELAALGPEPAPNH
jgi:hypothetical protein